MRVFTDLQSLPKFRSAVVTIGSFDGVHLGHRRILEKVRALAKAHGGESVVVTFDPHPRTVLNPADSSFKLLSTTEEKIQLLAQTGVDNVAIVPFTKEFAQLSAQQYVEDFLLGKFAPRYVVIGYDHRFGAGRGGDIAFLKEYERAGTFEVVEIPAHEVDEVAVSSTKIRNALEKSDIALANRLLGHAYSFHGKVVMGNQIGRTLGFPTANLEIESPHKLILPEGIYGASCSPVAPPAGRPGGALLYIGNRPTLSPTGKRVIEVHILGFEGDLYGQDLTVEVNSFIRPDKKLVNLDDLKKQIEMDKRTYLRQKTAVVILNYNTRRHLEEYLPSVVAHSEGAHVVVADNGSPDDSMAFVREQYPDITLIDLGQNWGFAEGYNRALKQVQATYYVILNSDVEVSPGWLDPILEEMEKRPSIAVAQPKILMAQRAASPARDTFEYAGASGGWIDCLGYPFCRGRIFSRREEDLGQYDEPQQCMWASGAAFFIRAELYHAFGGFDGDYFAHNEEIDLCWRLKRAGYEVWCMPQSKVWHLGGGTLEYESPRKVFLNFRNSLYSLLKNEPWGKLLWLLPARLMLDGLAGARFAMKRQFRSIWSIVLAHFSFYNNIRNTLKKRRQTDEIVAKQVIAPQNHEGVYQGSVVFAYYIRRIKTFKKLMGNDE
jgi:riboflavin kinase/FMN adenylyltransferase